MNWKVLKEEVEVGEIVKRSAARPQIIFKHSTRCAISSLAKRRLDKAEDRTDSDFYILDLVSYRSISDKVSEVFDVRHESPQVLVIRNGECVYDESHMSINMQDIMLHTEF